jgi:hypothetical protein
MSHATSLFRTLLASAALCVAAPAMAQDMGPVLAGAPVIAGRSADGYFAAPGYFGPDRPDQHAPDLRASDPRAMAPTSLMAQPPGSGPTPPKECYAKVKYAAQYTPARVAPHYVWRLGPTPPGAPGPVWCLVQEFATTGPTLISPEHFGWIKVNCDTGLAPMAAPPPAPAVAPVEAEGRYDRRTPAAPPAYPVYAYPAPVYPSYAAPQPCCRAPGRGDLTTLETGVVTWPGKSY